MYAVGVQGRITTECDMARPENVHHNAASLQALAKILRDKADRMEQVAQELKAAADNQFVTVAHQVTVDNGLTAIDLLILDVRKKISKSDYVEEPQ